ncbi:GNAT family N-acetyltransferase [Glaciibacter superstes]|uniref:GNAT family N-acetyltransferase n=1 Tax=Glaciibacter superstes TaxID=501023 RepID=UPI0003B617E7|nr:GNAT family N-acetyltransferase [Glaciibacter superstes]
MSQPDSPTVGEVDFRTFEVGDAAKIAAAWTHAAPQDGMTALRFRDLVLLDRNFDASGLFVAEQSGQVVGSAYAVRRRVAHDGDDLEPQTGWILYFFVTPPAQNNGVGRRLVTMAMDWLAGLGRSEVVFSSYTPNYVLPGLDTDRYPAASALLSSLGFETIERPSAMDRSLIGYQMPADIRQLVDNLRADGYAFDSPTSDELVPLIAMAGDRFNSDWARAIRDCVVGGMPLERIIVARDPAGTLLGWAMHGTYENVIERFGPFGVLPESRGTGLGKALLHVTLERMCALGAHSAWFLWADEDSTASHLYRKTGFGISRTFAILRAPLAPATAI